MTSAQQFQRGILETLVAKYEKSLKYTGENSINRRTVISPEKVCPGYMSNKIDLSVKNAFDDAAEECEKLGFIMTERGKYSSDISNLILADGNIAQTEQYMADEYGYVPLREKRNELYRLAEKYAGRSEALDIECRSLVKKLEGRLKVPDYDHEEKVLKALDFIGENKSRVYLREASMLIYGSSKVLEQEKGLLGDICRVLREYRPGGPGDRTPEDILRDFNIVKDPQQIGVKGRVLFVTGGRETDISGLPGGVQLFADDIGIPEEIRVETPVFMTVENHTSWLRLSDPDTTYFYLGGFMTDYQGDFLRKVYACSPDVRYLHFGDIDVGGFRIYRDLREKTGIPFEPYCMSLAELTDDRYQDCLQDLTKEDRKNLERLADEPEFAESIRYMLSHDVKLEQEIISYTLSLGRPR